MTHFLYGHGVQNKLIYFSKILTSFIQTWNLCTKCKLKRECNFLWPKSIPYSQALRISRICLSQNNFSAHIPNLKDWFLARYYPQKVVSEQINKEVFSKQTTHKYIFEQSMPFVATCHSKLKDLGKLLKIYNYSYIVIVRFEEFFSPAPIVSDRSVRKMKDYIARSKLYPVEIKAGSYRCGNSRCQIFKSIQATDTFSTFFTKSAYKINQNFNTNSKCLINLLSCKTCVK